MTLEETQSQVEFLPAKECVQIAKMLSEQMRLRILRAISSSEKGELNVTEMTQILEVQSPAISHHLALLLGQGLILKRRDGKHNFYSIVIHRFVAYSQTMKALLQNVITWNDHGEVEILKHDVDLREFAVSQDNVLPVVSEHAVPDEPTDAISTTDVDTVTFVEPQVTRPRFDPLDSSIPVTVSDGIPVAAIETNEEPDSPAAIARVYSGVVARLRKDPRSRFNSTAQQTFDDAWESSLKDRAVQSLREQAGDPVGKVHMFALAALDW